MRCMGCGEEMILVKVIDDVTMPVSGFQRHAYMCSTCNGRWCGSWRILRCLRLK